MSNWEMKGKPALIIIHMQHSIVAEEGTLAFLGFAKATKEAGIVPRQQALLKGFRKKKLPIIYVVATHPTAPTLPAYGKFWEALASTSANLPGSKDIEVIPELASQPDEPVIGNWPIGCFSNSNLEQLLKSHGTETLVLAGVATDIAMITTTLEAVALGYSVIVPKDACTSVNARAHEVVISDMLPGMGLVTTTEDVLAHI
jgi:nicotinamidase-related amidase